MLFRHFFQFIRLPVDSNPEDIFKLITEHWRLGRPQLLISVTGGAKTFNLDSRIEHNFAVGLLKVSKFVTSFNFDPPLILILKGTKFKGFKI